MQSSRSSGGYSTYRSSTSSSASNPDVEAEAPYRYHHKLQRPSSQLFEPLPPKPLEDLTCPLLPRAVLERPATAPRDWTGAPATPFTRKDMEREITVLKTGGRFFEEAFGSPLALGHAPPVLDGRRSSLTPFSPSAARLMSPQTMPRPQTSSVVLESPGGLGGGAAGRSRAAVVAAAPATAEATAANHAWHSPAPGPAGAHGRASFTAAYSSNFHGRLSSAGLQRGPSREASAHFSPFRLAGPATPMALSSPLCGARDLKHKRELERRHGLKRAMPTGATIDAEEEEGAAKAALLALKEFIGDVATTATWDPHHPLAAWRRVKTDHAGTKVLS